MSLPGTSVTPHNVHRSTRRKKIETRKSMSPDASSSSNVPVLSLNLRVGLQGRCTTTCVFGVPWSVNNPPPSPNAHSQLLATAGMGVPAVGGILYSMRNEVNLKLSQKLMHTRVYGQMTVVSMLVCTMTFQEVMRRNGGLFVVSTAEEPEDAEEGTEGETEGGVVAVTVASISP